MTRFCLAKSHILKTQQLEKCLEEVVGNSRVPYSIVIHVISGSEAYIINFGNRILISIGSKL